MEMIGEESNVRDRPIYLQVVNKDNLSHSFWYVIEEKDDNGIEEDEEEIHYKKKRKHRNNISVLKQSQRNNNNKISVLKQSETDEIRELRLPPLSSSFKVTLAVFNSRIYLFDRGSDGCCPSFIDVIYLDTNHPDKGWLNGPILKVPGRTLSVGTIENSGRFIAFGKNACNLESFAESLDVSLGSTWRPFPPIPEPERSQINDVRLLAVTDTKIYIHGVGDHYRLGLSFDLQNSEWNVFDRSFHGAWSPGVVLEFFSNYYLFSFGVHGLAYLQKSTSDFRAVCTQQLWVYDLNKCTWLPLPVQDLPDDDTVLPDPKYNRAARTYLFQMNQRNKMALIWSTSLPSAKKFANGIHCTKFIIDCNIDSNSQHPIFRAKIVSYGSYRIKCRGPVLNCAPLLIGKDKEEFDLVVAGKE